jgi:acyl-CoA reductase-like NAD-dependent aldehyde dehydrogenase
MADKEVFSNIINGAERPASGEMLDVIDPSTGEVYVTSPNSRDEDIDAPAARPRKRSRNTAGRHPVSVKNICCS